MKCAKCGKENPDGNCFCGGCGAPFPGASTSSEPKKTITVPRKAVGGGVSGRDYKEAMDVARDLEQSIHTDYVLSGMLDLQSCGCPLLFFAPLGIFLIFAQKYPWLWILLVGSIVCAIPFGVHRRKAKRFLKEQRIAEAKAEMGIAKGWQVGTVLFVFGLVIAEAVCFLRWLPS